MFKTFFKLIFIIIFATVFGVIFAMCSTSAMASERIVQQDDRGNSLYHKQQYVQVDSKLCPISASGVREYHKPCLVFSKTFKETK